MTATTVDFVLPDLGEGLSEAQILAWLVDEGDDVRVDQPIAEVETAKAAVEVPSPFAGTVVRRHGAVGDVVEVGQPLLTIATGERGFGQPSVDTPQQSGSVLVGYGTAPDKRRHGRRSRQVEPPAKPPAVKSPVVRKLARDLGVDLTTMRGSGADGLILRGDVEAAAHVPTSVATLATGQRTMSLTGARRTGAHRLTRSRREIPDATVWVDVDATGMLETRERLNRNCATDRQVSILGVIAKFTVAALRVHPELNASYDAETDSLLLHDHVNLGIAAQAPNGLFVPVIKHAQALTTRDLDAAIRDLVCRTREGTLSPSDLSGGTCTLNNYGVFDVDGSAAIINHPEVAIVGIGRILRRPWVVGEQVVARPVTELTLSFDHRVCDGATAASFLRFIRDCIAEPDRLIGEL